MKKKRLLALVLTFVLLLSLVPELNVEAAGRKLSKPGGFQAFWSGEYVGLVWDPVQNSAGYEVIVANKTYNARREEFYFHRSIMTLKNGNYTCSFKLRARSSSYYYSDSDYFYGTITMKAVDYTSPKGMISAGYLSKDDLIMYLKTYCKKGSYEVEYTDEYTSVIYTEKDESNSGFGNGASEAADGALTGGANALMENAEDLLLYGDLDDAWEVFKEGALEGAVGSGVSYALRDKNKRLVYVYKKGEEKFGVYGISYEYLAKNHSAPTSENLKNWSYNKDYGVYVLTNDDFQNTFIANYEVQGSGNNKKYVTCYMPLWMTFVDFMQQ